MYTECNGISIYYEETGIGRPLIMLHGNSEDHTIFDAVSQQLSANYRVILPDSRGHGKSGGVKELHYADMADDMISFMEQLDLRDVIFYGFSDGGIIGLLAAMKCDRITDLITSGANLTPDGVSGGLKLLVIVLYAFTKDPKLTMILKEPNITAEDLSKIKARTLVLAGSKDLVTRQETEAIAAGIPGADLLILDGEGHGSYIVHSRKIADILSGWLSHRQ
ncbi:MAG: alpha/beta hydrolase [Solobacterium sp.]|nr:alpha/beta hydrolase [Solobacterium sp.]